MTAVNPTLEQDLTEIRQIVLDGLGGLPARVYLFGSRANGTARERSDIDVAVWPLAELPVGALALIRDWAYRLGNRSALEWVLERHKERTPKDKTVAERFHTYRFADYKEEVVTLLGRVCRVSVETSAVVAEMAGSE